MTEVQKNLNLIKQSLPENVKLCAVSKFHSAQKVIEAIEAGQTIFGENRVQEAVQKFDFLSSKGYRPQLHIIGTLQRNKVKEAVRIASMIESADRKELVEEIEKQCAKQNKTIQILFEIHTGEESKAGFKSKEELFMVLDEFTENKYPHIQIKGLMTMAPLTEDENLIRKSFRELKCLQSELQEKYSNFDFSELSMGMSSDYKIAVEEGSTMVRIGTAIFGEREYTK